VSSAELSERAAALRRAFDETFVSAPARTSPTEDFLAVRLAGERHALRVADVARVAAAPRIVPIPSGGRAVLGLAAIGGALVAVHGLPALLGYEGAPAPRWIALARGAEGLGLGFDRLEGFMRVERGAGRVLSTGGLTYPVVDVAAVIESIMTRSHP